MKAEDDVVEGSHKKREGKMIGRGGTMSMNNAIIRWEERWKERCNEKMGESR